MAIGYANNLLYFFVFFLISMALTGMWMTNKNVDYFQIIEIQTDLLFAKEENAIDLLVKSRRSDFAIWDIEVKFAKPAENSKEILIGEVQQEKKVTFFWRPVSRGCYPVPRLLIEGRFPFKMLRAWKYYDEKVDVFVFPERRGIKQIPSLSGKQSEKEAQTQASDEGLFRDFREFQKSDPPQRIDWKRSLKHQKHLVKNFETSGERKVLLDWEMTQFLPLFEDRISQLAYWVDLCYQKKEIYKLKIKDYETPYGSHINHYKMCMQKLATMKDQDVA